MSIADKIKKESLLLGIKKNDFTFQATINYNFKNFIDKPSYNVVCDGKTFSLIFSTINTRIYAKTYYKNTIFEGNIMAHNIWDIYLLNQGLIVCKQHDSLKIKGMTQSVINEEAKELTNNNKIEVDYSLNETQQELFDSMISKYKNLLRKVDNIELCKEQLKELIFIKEEDEDDYDDDYDFKDEYIKDCKEYINNFIQAEQDKENIEELVTLENIIQVYPDLKKIKKHTLKQYFERFYNEYDIESFFEKSAFEFEESIYYDRELSLQNIGSTINKYHLEYLKEQFEKEVPAKVEFILGKQFHKVKNADSIIRKICMEYRFSSVPSDEELAERAHYYLNRLIEFNNLFEKCLDEYGTNEILIELYDDKEKRFDIYEQTKTGLSDNEIKEYECVYKIIKPFYRTCLFRKNSNKFKPSIQNFNTFIEFVNQIYKTLIDNQFLIEVGEDTFTYNTSVDYDEIIKQINEIK